MAFVGFTWGLGNFPAGSNPWNSEPVSVAPAFTAFVPNTTLAAESVNYLFNVAFNNINWLQQNTAVPASQQFTANGTWTAPAGVTQVIVDMCGGGGGGGGGCGGFATTAKGASAGAGGAGALRQTRVVTVTPGVTYDVVIGVGGAGGTGGAASSNGTDGADGGVTYFCIDPAGSVLCYALGAAGGGRGNANIFTGGGNFAITAGAVGPAQGFVSGATWLGAYSITGASRLMPDLNFSPSAGGASATDDGTGVMASFPGVPSTENHAGGAAGGQGSFGAHWGGGGAGGGGGGAYGPGGFGGAGGNHNDSGGSGTGGNNGHAPGGNIGSGGGGGGAGGSGTSGSAGGTGGTGSDGQLTLYWNGYAPLPV